MTNTPICNTDTPDPWMIEHQNQFYLTFTAGDHVEIWRSQVLEDFENCQKSVVWKPQPGAPWSADVWAPELHYINHVWYIYVACAHPAEGNKSHRTMVLRSTHNDPMDPAGWTFLGPLKGVPDHWAIDATVFELNMRLYCCYSGWPLGDFSDTRQDLFLVEMINPEEAKLDTLVTISKPQLSWEIIDKHGINEGPEFLLTPHFMGIIYSACGSWTNKYKLAALQLTGPPERILEPSSWTKWERPLMMSDPEGRGGPHGPGHASFVHERNGNGRIFCIYHATKTPTDGWANRKAHVCCFTKEVFMSSTETLICGRGMRKAALRGDDTGNDGTTSSGPPAGSHGHGVIGMVDRIKEKVKDRLKEL